MQSVRDVDAFLLATLALASKRRPAELAEIMAAADLTHGAIPYRSDLGDAFHQLSTHGLICEVEGRYTLTPDAQKIMATQPRKASTAALIASVKEALYAYNAVGESAPVLLTELELSDAIATHRTSGQGAGKNMLMPKSKVPETRYQRAIMRGKPTSSRSRKA
jgi:hypothetical protein